MRRVAFLVDGFNLYHSVVDIGRNNAGLCVKWLNIDSLCKSFLPLLGKDTILEHIYYFSAYAFHLKDSGVIQRHKIYIECLEATGIIIELGRFKYKEIKCPYCKKIIPRHEEKETDVSIGIKLCELLYGDKCDIIVLITGDTDLAPAVRHTKKCLLNKSIIFAFPYGRFSSELQQIAPGSFKISKNSYIRHQFPDNVLLPDGMKINKPIEW